ncbi:hybrid sensor histidine kinase/response regulator [Ramlibacter sp. USB13]|uniref:histidine kinase n=1 Tax=Ramlibacter cellulosilyticus TaxID=2764187 RepID=A0A923SDK7_9BURK|nr:hybrid sensor histidine kinase/response regulator [Ramlibacter cellulosilyticus]MBC5786024.1 hybrid sensor histidine kinase/response regulator [Ramlibacter cellulosilyticus]
MAAQEETGTDGDTSAELVRTSLDVILAQTRAGGYSALAIGVILGFMIVPAAGWAGYLAWFAVLLAGMVLRQPYFHRVLRRAGPTEATLRHIAIVSAATGWVGSLSVPLFARFIGQPDLSVLTIIISGWLAVAVSILAVQPRVYAGYLAASLATMFVGWVGQGTPRELLLIGVSMLFGAPMLVRLAWIVQSQLRDTVQAAQQNAVLVRQLREALVSQQETQRARSRFLGAASHDLRQPVQALLFLADIFRRSTDPTRRDAMAQQIVRTGESIDGMFRHLVDFAQIDAGTMRAVVQPVQLEQLLAAAASGFAEKCAARGLRFRMEVPGACTVSADPVLLERMLRNFLDNAYKYSLHGEIVLKVDVEGDEVVVCVSDEGVGMEPEDLAQACNAFFRGRSASVAEAEGIGLGLAISRHMADLMALPLKITSEPRRGTKVTVRLPLAHPGRRQVAAGPDHGSALLQGRLVAVVENDRLAREALCAWLLDAGARVAQGGSLAQLMQVLGNAGTAPDLMLADYRLSEGTGVDAVQAVRAAYGPVPAWIVSGEPDIADRGLALPVLQKPITPERLLAALRTAFPG